MTKHVEIEIPFVSVRHIDEIVVGEIVDVAPHLMEWSFAAVKFDSGRWNVTNIETGCTVTTGWRSRADAIAAAEFNLRNETDDSVHEAVRRSLRRHGIPVARLRGEKGWQPWIDVKEEK